MEVSSIKRGFTGKAATECDLVHAAVLAYLHDLSKKEYIKEHKDTIDLEEVENTEPGKLVNLIPYLNDLKRDEKSAISICRMKVKLRRLKSMVLAKHLEKAYETLYQDQLAFWGDDGNVEASDLEGVDLSTLVNVPPTNQMNKGIVSLWKVPTPVAETPDVTDGEGTKKNSKKRERSAKDNKESSSKRQKGMLNIRLVLFYFIFYFVLLI